MRRSHCVRHMLPFGEHSVPARCVGGKCAGTQWQYREQMVFRRGAFLWPCMSGAELCRMIVLPHAWAFST